MCINSNIYLVGWEAASLVVAAVVVLVVPEFWKVQEPSAVWVQEVDLVFLEEAVDLAAGAGLAATEVLERDRDLGNGLVLGLERLVDLAVVVGLVATEALETDQGLGSGLAPVLEKVLDLVVVVDLAATGASEKDQVLESGLDPGLEKGLDLVVAVGLAATGALEKDPDPGNGLVLGLEKAVVLVQAGVPVLVLFGVASGPAVVMEMVPVRGRWVETPLHLPLGAGVVDEVSWALSHNQALKKWQFQNQVSLADYETRETYDGGCHAQWVSFQGVFGKVAEEVLVREVGKVHAEGGRVGRVVVGVLVEWVMGMVGRQAQQVGDE